MTNVLQFTDMHLRDDPAASVRGVNPQQCFDATLYHARCHHWPADAVLLTGDLANDEFNNSYTRLAAIAASWETPVLAVPGNHDDGRALRAAFDAVDTAADNVLDFDAWRIIALDSQVRGAVHGRLSTGMLTLLEDAASTRSNRHLLVALHHQPVSLGSAWLEPIGLHDAQAFRDMLTKLGARACLFGHAHQAWDSVEGGVRYLGTPSTGRQFVAGADEFAESDQPPAYRWLKLHDNGELETGVEWVGKMRRSQ